MSEVLSCFDPAANPGGMLPVAESIQTILNQIDVQSSTEILAVSEAVDRILAVDLVSGINVPQQRNSAMDGYAVAADSLSGEPLEVIGRVFAGEAFLGKVGADQAVEIMTGAPVPEGADSVIIKEACTREGDRLTFVGQVKQGQNVREAGEDISEGETALKAGCLLRPQELGLIASLGHTEVTVYRSLKVAIFSTGDEVTAQGQPLPENCIYDTNRFSLTGLLQRLGCEVIDYGIIEDSQKVMEETLRKASKEADMVISSGGVSMGQADFIKDALAAVGEINFWRIAMRPGRPLAFGKLGNTPFFGLPGNPVAVMVTFTQFVQPALRKMAGELNWQPRRMAAIAETSLRSRPGRTDYSRGVYSINENGELVVRSTGSQGSGILTSMVSANCLIEIVDEFASIEVGQKVIIQPFSDLV
ncbi:bifunctional molybdopterin-guanine dinucleotide biosynthesis adaptor protein MobB/molybdopterin molybdotransferase MoeA [Neptuniibacter sp. SY11_33]|uniref:bifunctional molybdopterin-guanine dinucleotide biosynthesis adaptor protein MobB/molybdopterin molybdotransferase MoeA n=1 Tax=Neptuniibacter sp. SY11_33 TaxID=3398215 RepID=UPI0039F61F2B